MTVQKFIDAAPRSRPYHHGNLRAAVMKAALETLRTRTPETLSLRELARTVGVGHSALYAHFRDRDELLAIIAGEGFLRLAEALKSAAADGTDPVGAMALAYLAFARTSPEHYRTMFRPENVTDANMGHVFEASERCFALLVDAIRQGDRLTEDEARERSVGIWSMLHGLVGLGADSGPLQQKVPSDQEPAVAARLARMLAAS